MEQSGTSNIEPVLYHSQRFLSKKIIILSILLLILLLIGVFYLYKSNQLNMGYVKYNPQKNSYNSSKNANSNQGNNNPQWNNASNNMIMQAQNLPSCNGTNLFNYPLVQPSTISYIDPLGHSSSYNGNAGHVIPVDHMYVNLKLLSPMGSPIVTSPATIYAPANVEIYQLTDVTDSRNGNITNHDYTLFFAPCKEVTVYLGHIDSISDTIQNALINAQKYCNPPNVIDNTTYENCTYSFLLNLNSGDTIGTAGGSGHTTQAFDFGVYDIRNKPLPFINQKYETPENLQAVCGLDYYATGSAKTSLYNSVKNTKKNKQGFPDCGTNMQDIKGTLQGNWYLPNTATNMGVPNTSAIVFNHLNTDPNTGQIDWGGAIAPADSFSYKPITSGTVNRDPSQVTSDGTVYCYSDSSYYQDNQQVGAVLLVQMTDANTINTQFESGKSCTSAIALTSPTQYVR